MLNLRNWLLLYRPTRARAWIYRVPFYVVAFFLVPLFGMAALGAYVGPDQTAGGFIAPVLLVAVAVFIRSRALRHDATLPGAGTTVVGQRLADQWPFPVDPPPTRHPLLGSLVTLTGLAMIVVGMAGGGLLANSVLWPVLITSGMFETGAEFDLPIASVVGLGILGAVAGASMSFLGLSLGPGLRDLGRRLSLRDARLLVQRPGEGPVLLLRSFEDEAMRDPRPVSLLQFRYEEGLARALRQLGPVITVGRPGDTLGFAGAARLYVPDTHWRQAIQYLVAHSAAVVIVVGRTEGLWWEIETSLSTAPRDRLLLFFPAVTKSSSTQSLWDRYKDFVAGWNLTRKRYAQMEAERHERYRLFRQRCGRLLDLPLPETLGHCYFVDFLPSGEARVLRSKRGMLQHFGVDIIPRFRRVRFSMSRTLWPFIAKVYAADGIAAQPLRSPRTRGRTSPATAGRSHRGSSEPPPTAPRGNR